MYLKLLALFCFTTILSCVSTTQRTPSNLKDGEIINLKKYMPPEFSQTDFNQTPDIREFYEKEIVPAYEKRTEKIAVDEIIYSSDSLKVKGYILKPLQIFENRKLPIVVFNHGGNRNYGKLGIKDLIWLSRIAEKGYIVVASQYRGVDGGEGVEEFGGDDVHDVKNILKVARSLPYADLNRNFVMGHSRGGMMTYLAIKDNHDYKAAVILAGECDLKKGLVAWPDFEKRVFTEVIPNYNESTKDELLAVRSACSWPEKIDTPVYILQGDKDKNVEPFQATDMAEQLRKLGKKVKIDILTGSHSLFFLSEYENDIISRIDNWFKIHSN